MRNRRAAVARGTVRGERRMLVGRSREWHREVVCASLSHEGLRHKHNAQTQQPREEVAFYPADLSWFPLGPSNKLCSQFLFSVILHPSPTTTCDSRYNNNHLTKTSPYLTSVLPLCWGFSHCKHPPFSLSESRQCPPFLPFFLPSSANPSRQPASALPPSLPHAFLPLPFKLLSWYW